MKTIIEKRNPRLIKITDAHWEKLGRLAIDRGITKQRNRSDMIALLVEEAEEFMTAEEALAVKFCPGCDWDLCVCKEQPPTPPAKEREAGDYKQARGVFPWKEGDELPEEAIRRSRGHQPEHHCPGCGKPDRNCVCEVAKEQTDGS